jgi:hypothetical protein
MALIDVGGTVSGAGSVTGTAYRKMIVSGRVEGDGALTLGHQLEAGGTLAGSGSVTGTLRVIKSVSGNVRGSGAVVLSYPEPLVGSGTLTAFMEVTRVPPSPCSSPTSPCCPTLEFRWLQAFQKGDLTLSVVDNLGRPVGPVEVSYALFQVLPSCVLVPHGCGGRQPAMASLGVYYATGNAGEGGQPGLWLIRWSYRKSIGGPVIVQDVNFRVVDSILRHIPGDLTQRGCKYGWGD